MLFRSDDECEKLKAEYGEALTDEAVIFLDEYIEMKGYKAKNHYLAIKKWVVDAVDEERRRKNKGTGNYQSREQAIANRIDDVDSW